MNELYYSKDQNKAVYILIDNYITDTIREEIWLKLHSDIQYKSGTYLGIEVRAREFNRLVSMFLIQNIRRKTIV